MNTKRNACDKLKSACSVSQMAQLLGLSRTRFYQLQKQGVFPLPLYDLVTKRPFYPPAFQKRCLAIRRTGIGENHRQILFYERRKKTSRTTLPPLTPRYQVFIKALRQMGIKTTPKQLKAALKNLYPEGVPQPIDDGLVVRDLLQYGQNRLST